MAAQHPENPYSFAYEVQGDAAATFECSEDARANPWLALPPHHPVVVQTQAFWTAVGGSQALQGWEETKWTALTWTSWELGDASGGHAVRGVYRLEKEDGKLGYAIELLNAKSAAVVTIRGRGVVFRNRNFEQWREGAKEEARKAAPSEAFTFAHPDALGLVEGEQVLVAPFKPGDPYVEALVTKANGLPPGNTFIGGSGDHVNSTHLHELARQALFLIKGRSDIDTSGEMTMKRYVELGTPLRLTIAANEAQMARFEVEQLGKACSEIELRW